VPERCLLLFTKPVRAGRVKTRLTRGEGALSPERAARLHAAFLGDLAERLLPAVAAGEMRLRVAWALDDGAPLPDLAAEVARCGVALRGEGGLELPAGLAVDAVRQRGGDLGARLFAALADAAADHPRGVAAVGSDHPALPLARVRQAFAHLDDGADAVLGPAGDGGYYLLALAAGAVRERIFENVPWSTPGVLAATEARCRELGLRLALLPAGDDVDEPADLERLAAALAEGNEGDEGDEGDEGENGEAADCPRTRRLLAAWGRWPATAGVAP
jgi:hypothetical protein